jgi:hypothetical protein
VSPPLCPDWAAIRRRELIERTWLALVAGRQGPAHMLTLDHEMATLFAVAVDLVDDFLAREKALP